MIDVDVTGEGGRKVVSIRRSLRGVQSQLHIYKIRSNLINFSSVNAVSLAKVWWCGTSHDKETCLEGFDEHLILSAFVRLTGPTTG